MVLEKTELFTPSPPHVTNGFRDWLVPFRLLLQKSCNVIVGLIIVGEHQPMTSKVLVISDMNDHFVRVPADLHEEITGLITSRVAFCYGAQVFQPSQDN